MSHEHQLDTSILEGFVPLPHHEVLSPARWIIQSLRLQDRAREEQHKQSVKGIQVHTEECDESRLCGYGVARIGQETDKARNGAVEDAQYFDCFTKMHLFS